VRTSKLTRLNKLKQFLKKKQYGGFKKENVPTKERDTG
jgi:hypothetical protein